MKTLPIIAMFAACMGVLTVAACGPTPASGQTSAQQKEAAITAANTNSFQARCATSALTSQEKNALCERARRINVQNMASCITLFLPNGTYVAQYPVKGKVASLNSYLLPGDQVVERNYGSYWAWGITTEAPDIDGAYGKNAEGIFFITADTDAYVEWSGIYHWSDQCLPVSAEPLLVQSVAQE
jgi:hypothetical protein